MSQIHVMVNSFISIVGCDMRCDIVRDHMPPPPPKKKTVRYLNYASSYVCHSTTKKVLVVLVCHSLSVQAVF